MQSINPGELRHRVTIQQHSSVPDSFGQPQRTWSDVATVWARIEPLSVRELYASGNVASQISHRITMRYRAGLVPGMRIVFGLHIYRLQGAVNRRLENTLVEWTCLEVNGNG